MAAKQKAPTVAAVRGEAVFRDGLRRNFTGLTSRRKPAFAKQFHLAPRQVAVVRVGWPMRRPPPANELALPPGESPSGFDWSMVRGEYVFACPPTGQFAPADLLRELGIELARAGVRSVILWDGLDGFSEFWADAAERPGGAP